MAFIGNTNTTQAFTPAIDYFSGNGSTTAFTLSRPVASVAQVQVTIDNVAQNPSSAYTVSANTITFTSAPLSGTNNIYVYYTSPITQVIAPGQGTVNSTALVDASVTAAKLASTTGTGAVALASLPTFTTTIGVGGATASASGSGVSFPATQSASSDANTLDDYEEGTYTMTWTPGTSGSITLSNSTANYTKIGRVVIVNTYVNVGSVSSPVGTLNISIPFTSASSNSSRSSCWIAFNSLNTGGNIATAWPIVEANSNSCTVYIGTGQAVSSTFANYVQASTDARITMVYITS